MYLRTLVALALLGLSCSTGRTSLGGVVSYGETAEQDYRYGNEALASKDFVEATKFFEHVRTKYPFSKYASLADLRLADVKFDQDHFIEAAGAYAEFVKLHPNHPSVDYAAYRVGLSYWKDAPGDFILFPPSYEKDLGQVHQAVKSLADFVKSYPRSKYRPEAEKLLEQARGKLIDHEWYVAHFYAKRGHWAGAAGRLERLVKDYPGSPREAAALFELAQAYLKLDERYQARQALQQLIVKHPRDGRRAAAEKLLASLR
jgi:outer membrane protein assembly factor BamD